MLLYGRFIFSITPSPYALVMHLLKMPVFQRFFTLERAMGIEPTTQAWEARILPLNYARMQVVLYSFLSNYSTFKKR